MAGVFSMRRMPILSTCLMAALALPARAQTSPSVTVEIQQVVRSFAYAANAGDMTAYLELFSQDPAVTTITNGFIRRGPSTIKAAADSVLGRVEGYKTVVGDIDITTVGPSSALVVAPFTLTPIGGDGSVRQGAVTFLLQRGTQGWKIFHQHASVIQPAPGS